MAVVEDLIQGISPKSAIFLVFGAGVLYVFARWIDEQARLARLPGARSAATVPSWVPFGLYTVHRMVQASKEDRNLQRWCEIFEQTGNTYTAETRILHQRVIFTADPENIKAILAAQFTDYGKGKPFHDVWQDFLGDGIFTTDGDKWHASRQLIRPQFVKDRVSDLQCFENHMQTLFKCVAKGGALDGENDPIDINAGNGKAHDFSDILFRYTLDVATDFLLGTDVKSMSAVRQPFADSFAEVQRLQGLMARAGPLVSFVPRAGFNRGLEVINEFVNVYIERALKLSPEELATKSKSDEGYTFLHALAGFTRDRKILRDQLLAVLLAGRDTTASTLSWTIYELARNPEIVKRLRTEILETVGPTRAPTYTDLKGMKYLQNIMNETLRLYPAVPFNVRLALKDTTLPRGGGPDGTQPLAVLKDTPIGYSTLVMQRRADLYPPESEKLAHPSVFSPERWFHWQPKPWLFIPFNGGPRICIGQQFALTEMGYVICRLFQRFERVDSHMQQVDGGHPKLKSDIVLQPGQGVDVSFWKAEGGI